MFRGSRKEFSRDPRRGGLKRDLSQPEPWERQRPGKRGPHLPPDFAEATAMAAPAKEAVALPSPPSRSTVIENDFTPTSAAPRADPTPGSFQGV